MIKASRITGLAMMVASLVLGTGGVALAKAPPDPHTIGATTLSSIELNGQLGTKFTVHPGEELKVSANWSDANGGCPDCIDFVAAGFAGQPAPAGCLENAGVNGEEESGEVDLGPAPTKPGKYRVVAHFEEQFECGAAWNGSESKKSKAYPVIMDIMVKKPGPPPDPHTIGATTLSSIALNGKPHTVITARPGQDVKVSANWSDANEGCPSCIDFVAVAFAGQSAAGCIENPGSDTASGSGEVDLGPAPMAPGTYDVATQFEEQFQCGAAWNAGESTSYPVLAQVKVKGKPVG